MSQHNIIDKKNISKFDQFYRANFVNSLSGFKSANLLGTKDKSGNTNLSVISSAFHLGAEPALIGFIIRPDTVPRHSLNNIRETKVCTLNHINDLIFKQAHHTSARYPKEVSEFLACDLQEEYIGGFYAPFVLESKIKMALELIREVKIEENGTHLLICTIEKVILPKECISNDGTIAIENCGTVTVSGLNTYHRTTTLERLKYAKPR